MKDDMKNTLLTRPKDFVDPEFCVSGHSLTSNQVAAIVDQHGGWPAWATELRVFRAIDQTEVATRFCGPNGADIRSLRVYEDEHWKVVLTRDEYYLRGLSPEALRNLKDEIRREVVSNLRSRLY